MLNHMDLMVTAAESAITVLVLILVATLKARTSLLAFMVGATGALIGVQVLEVHAFTITVVLWVVMGQRTFDPRSVKFVVAIMVAAAIMATTAIVGDLVVSPTLALQLLALAGSASLILAFSAASDRRQMIMGLLAFATLSSFVGVLQVLKIAPVEIWHASVSAIGRPIGLYSEPDWLGLFAGLGLIIAWRSPIRPALRTIAITLNGASLVLAFARAGWVAVVASVAIVIFATMFIKRQRGNTGGRRGAVGLLALGALGVFLFAPQLVSDLTNRLANTLSPGAAGPDISGQARVNQIASLTELANSAPFYGHGLSASGRVLVFGGIDTGSGGGNAVSSNWLLGLWVDGAFLSLPLIAVFLVAAARTGQKLAGQLLVVALINSLFSNVFFSPITWMLIALCLADLIHREGQVSSSQSSERGRGRGNRDALTHSTHEALSIP
jgi:hypothetical protein